MCKKLVLVRHGDAEAKGPDGDMSRRLTREGLDRLKLAYPGAFARLRGQDGLVLWASPAVRAQETARVVAAALGLDPSVIEDHQSLYDQDLLAFREDLRAADADTVVAVGHIPFMERLATSLTGSPQSFSKGAVLALDMTSAEPGSAHVLWDLVP